MDKKSRNIMKKYNTGIYQIVNQINNKRYIGSAVDLYNRKHIHFSTLKNNNHKNKHLQQAYNKYGKNNFTFKILLLCDKKNLLFYEQRIIDSYYFNSLYNLLPKAGNWLGHKHTKEKKQKISIIKTGKKLSQETRNKMSKSRKGRKISEYQKQALIQGKRNATISLETRKKLSTIAKNRILSFETKQKISNSLKGRIFTKETRRKKSLAQMGNKNHRFGKHPSKKTIKKMQESQKRSKHHCAKAIYQIDKNTNSVIKTWFCINDAADFISISSTCISIACKDNSKTAGGYKWQYVK